jgi:hypothetical protein
VFRATTAASASAESGRVSTTVAIVSDDDLARLAIVKALDGAPVGWILELHREPPQDADVVVCDPGAAIEGAIVFEPGPIDLIERISACIRCPGRTFLVSGPSGGTGATSVAVHLSAAFAARGHATTLVDLDPERGARMRLGLDPDDEPGSPVPVAGGFRLLTAIGQTVGSDRVVVDAPRSVIDEVNAFAAGVLVCSPSPQGARRCRALLDAHADLRWHVIVNRSGPGGETTRSQFERLVGCEVTELPCCAALRDAEDEGRLLRPGWSRWSRSIARLAEMLDA